MLRRVSEGAVRRLLCLAVLALGVLAGLTARADTAVTGAVGVDVWGVQGGPARYLPNYSTPNAFKAVAPWVSAKVTHDWGTGVRLTVEARHHQVDGNRVDRADVDVDLGDDMGVRVGVLPYRVSWCRPLGAGPWVKEPDAFCRFAGLNEIATGAAGAQLYKSWLASGWLVDGMAGVYRPRIDKQDDNLGIYVSVGPTVRHTKAGASVQALSLGTGVLLRASYLHTQQDQDDASGSKSAYQRRMRWDTWYLAADLPLSSLAPGLSTRLSVAAYPGEQINPANPSVSTPVSATGELIYMHGPNTWAAGLSRYQNTTRYSYGTQRLEVPSLSLAWSRALTGGMRLTLQATRTVDRAVSAKGVVTDRAGSAFGARISKIF